VMVDVIKLLLGGKSNKFLTIHRRKNALSAQPNNRNAAKAYNVESV
jgi:hypothetical protein